MLEKYLYENFPNKKTYPYLNEYWNDKSRKPFFILHNSDIIGFVLVNNMTVYPAYDAHNAIAEFYIKPEQRKKGFGKQAAIKTFELYKGKWEVSQEKTNSRAIAFWRNVISEFTNDEFEEVIIAPNRIDVIVQLFNTK